MILGGMNAKTYLGSSFFILELRKDKNQERAKKRAYEARITDTLPNIR